MKELICSAIGVLGAVAAWAFGGWYTSLAALMICMAVDYISGSTVALVFHKSRKTTSGAYNSAYGLKGLCKKGLMLLFVVVAVQADRLLGSDYVRDAVCSASASTKFYPLWKTSALPGCRYPKP